MEEQKKKDSRGGARPGSGRKPRSYPVKTITLTIPQDIYDRLPPRGDRQRFIVAALSEKLDREGM